MNRSRKSFTDSELEAARRMRARGISWARIGERFNCGYQTIRYVLDQDYADRQDGTEIARRKREAAKRAKARPRNMTHVVGGNSAAVNRDADALMREIPADTRDLTGRLFGDPLPGRMALDHAERTA